MFIAIGDLHDDDEKPKCLIASLIEATLTVCVISEYMFLDLLIVFEQNSVLTTHK
jgi:hypothetical protein